MKTTRVHRRSTPARVSLAGTLAALLLLLAACGSGGAGQANGSPPPKSVHAQITFWTLELASFAPYIHDVIGRFNKEYPNVKVNWVDVPGNQTQEKYVASFAGGQAPNLVNLSFQSLVQDQQDFLDWRNYLTTKQLDNFVKPLRETMVVNGKQLAIPFYGTAEDYPVIYNMTLLNKAGITKVPTTYEEMWADGAKLHQAEPNAYWGLGGESPVTSTAAEGLLESYKIPILSPDLKRAVFDTPAAVHVLEQVQKAWKAGVYYPDSGNTSANDQQDALFLEGAIASYGNGITGQVGKQLPSIQDHLQVGPQILGPLGKFMIQPGQFLALSKGQSSTDAYLSAALAMQFETNQSEVEFFHATNDRIGPNTYSALNLPIFKTLPPTSQPIIREYEQYTHASVPLAVPYSPTLKGNIPSWPHEPDIQQDLQKQWDLAVTGQESAQQALKTAQDQANQLLQT